MSALRGAVGWRTARRIRREKTTSWPPRSRSKRSMRAGLPLIQSTT